MGKSSKPRKSSRPRRTWKEFYITDRDERRRIISAWQNAGTFGKDKLCHIDHESGIIETNLSERDCRTLFRFAGVPWRDYVSGMRNFPEDHPEGFE